MTREEFKELFGLKDDDLGMEYADDMHESGVSWFEVAKATINTMNHLLTNEKRS